ncbi:MAG: glycosyltransferase, partial [Psychrosphaera sp.]|nr:glycosyltransferase [Psychrosphaera sp.]
YLYEKELNLVSLSGLTGSGKSEILELIQAKDTLLPIIHLEECAGHASSVFGEIRFDIMGKSLTKTQYHFEMNIFHQILPYLKEDESLPIFLTEKESRRIGKLELPPSIHQALSLEKHIELDCSVKERVNRDLFVVLNAPDVQWLKGDDRPRNENGKVTLYHHGNIHHRCGIDRILPALKTLLDDNQPVEVEVHGGGPFLAEVERVANDLEVSEHCTFGGRYPSEELAKRMENADIGLVTNRTSPFATLCMPIKLLEYVECKLPVICTRMETANYYFDETMVYFFDDESEIPALVKRIMNNPDEVKRKTEKAYAKYQEITWAAQKPKYQAFIQNA